MEFAEPFFCWCRSHLHPMLTLEFLSVSQSWLAGGVCALGHCWHALQPDSRLTDAERARALVRNYAGYARLVERTRRLHVELSSILPPEVKMPGHPKKDIIDRYALHCHCLMWP